MFEQLPLTRHRWNRPVWVRLDTVYRQLNFPPRPPPRGTPVLQVRGEVPGKLHDWLRTSTGEWLGLVSFSVPYAELLPSEGLQLVDQLVPAEALRPRTYGSYRAH